MNPASSAQLASIVLDLDVSLIFVAKGRKKRTLDLKDEKDLHFIESIRTMGYLQAIEVREVPNAPKPYELVFGHRRLGAAKHLGLATIPARIVPVTDKYMTVIAVIENTHRRHMDYHEYLKQLKVWLKQLEATSGPDPGKSGNNAKWRAGSTRDPATQQFVRDSRPEGQGSPSSAEPALDGDKEVGESEDPTNPTHRQTVSQSTGRAYRTVADDVELANAFTDDQLCVLQYREVSRDHMLRISKLGAEGIADAVNHLSGGETADRAIELAQAKLKAEAAAAKTPKPPKESDMSDADWLMAYCPKMRGALQDPTHFDRDALLYREVRTDLGVLRLRIRDGLKKALGKGYSPFARLLYNAVYPQHPDDWYICSECGGRNADQPECDYCNGRGFKLRFVDKK